MAGKPKIVLRSRAAKIPPVLIPPRSRATKIPLVLIAVRRRGQTFYDPLHSVDRFAPPSTLGSAYENMLKKL